MTATILLAIAASTPVLEFPTMLVLILMPIGLIAALAVAIIRKTKPAKVALFALAGFAGAPLLFGFVVLFVNEALMPVLSVFAGSSSRF